MRWRGNILAELNRSFRVDRPGGALLEAGECLLNTSWSSRQREGAPSGFEALSAAYPITFRATCSSSLFSLFFHSSSVPQHHSRRHPWDLVSLKPINCATTPFHNSLSSLPLPSTIPSRCHSLLIHRLLVSLPRILHLPAPAYQGDLARWRTSGSSLWRLFSSSSSRYSLAQPSVVWSARIT